MTKFPADILPHILAFLLQSRPHAGLLGNRGTFLHGLLYRVLGTLPNTVLADTTVLKYSKIQPGKAGPAILSKL